jgi:hypothetical protein
MIGNVSSVQLGIIFHFDAFNNQEVVLDFSQILNLQIIINYSNGPKKIIVNNNCFSNMNKYSRMESSNKFTFGCYNLTDEAYSSIDIIKNE